MVERHEMVEVNPTKNGDPPAQQPAGGSAGLSRSPRSPSPYLPVILELLILGIWAVMIGQPYINFDSNVLPAGREFGSAIQTHSVWTQLKTCSWCAFWNGSGQGGYPAFADTHGSMPHPLIMVSTLIWGVLKGTKISLVIAFWVAGLAQWWLARELKVGWLPRIWSALMVMVAGHLSGRMEMGVFGVLFSTAMTSLIFAALIHASRGQRPRSIVLLGLVVASSLLSGQGYLQIGLVFIIPASLILIYDGKCWSKTNWQNFALAFGLGAMLAAFFLVPLAHFLPNFAKDMDPEFASAQKLPYIPLNLVINDPDFYRSELLDKFSFPYLYTLYIGWVPVILAAIGLGTSKKEVHREHWFLLTAALLAFFAASALPFQWLVGLLPSLAGIRQPSLIAGLAVPPILGLSAFGLDRILALDWPTLSISFSARTSSLPKWNFSLMWLLLVPLVYSLYQGYLFSRNWIYTDMIQDGVYQLLDELQSQSAQWVNPPFGEHYYLAVAVEKGLKISPGIRPWHWKGRENPPPSIEAVRSGRPQDSVEIKVVDQIGIYGHPEETYAAVLGSGKATPCQATSNGGKITVFCNQDHVGTLIVRENMWNGWNAWVDGNQVPLIGETWLELDALPGEHTYQFRYQPWDVPLGLFITFTGIVLALYFWYKDPQTSSNTEANLIQSTLEF